MDLRLWLENWALERDVVRLHPEAGILVYVATDHDKHDWRHGYKT
jgi:hypothetical protein